MPKTKDLTLKQKKFLKVYWETGNATRAVLEAYNTKDPGIASTMGSENLVKLKDILRYQMDKKGLTVEKLVERVQEATDATKWNDFTGEKEPDHAIRLKAVEKAERWLGLQQDTPTVAVQINNVIADKKKEYDL